MPPPKSFSEFPAAFFFSIVWALPVFSAPAISSPPHFVFSMVTKCFEDFLALFLIISYFVTVQSQADLSKKGDECLHSWTLFCTNLFGGYATLRKYEVFSRLALNSSLILKIKQAGLMWKMTVQSVKMKNVRSDWRDRGVISRLTKWNLKGIIICVHLNWWWNKMCEFCWGMVEIK